jgi:hypothetical protein
MSYFIRTPKFFLILMFLLAFFFRWNMIANQEIYFTYDQARDALTAQEIIEQRDLKIQGPSASGTHDSVYHGVAYYYVLAPLYF